MNDFDYDALQKKRIAAGARHMRRGSRSKRCFLPSDNLTPAQLKRRNGPVSTYKLDAPMRWDDFKEMPADLQKQYLTYLVETYGATNEMLGDMFYVHPTYVGAVKKALGVVSQNPHRVIGEKKAIRDHMWAAFCNGVVGGGDAVKETPKEPPKETPKESEKVETLPVRCPDELEEAALTSADTEAPTEAEPVVVNIPELDMTELSATFNGWFTPETFLGWITKLPIPKAEVKIRVSVTKRGEAV